MRARDAAAGGLPTAAAPLPRTMAAGDWAMLFALSMLWGGSFFFGKLALSGFAPFTVVLGRVAIAALALHLVLAARGRRLRLGQGRWLRYAAMGTLNNLIPFTLIVWSQTRIDSGLAAILNATTPLFAALLAHFLTRDERLTANRLAGVTAGLAGVTVMVGPAVLGVVSSDMIAESAVLGAALSYAFAGIYGRRFRTEPPLETAAGQVTASALMVLPLSLMVDQPWLRPVPAAGAWAALAALALLGTALAYLVYFRLLARAGAGNLLLVTLLIPASALILGAAFLGERVPVLAYVGLAMILSGLLLLDGRLLRNIVARSRSGRPQRAA